jgi:conjugal transfer mating pair stabilization protein TraG
MASPYTIYAYFNSQEIAGVLNAVVNLLGAGNDYLTLVKIFAIIGVFMACCIGFVRARGEDAGVYVVALALFYGGLFIPRASVMIEEVSGGGAPIPVDNVPLGLAFFASTTSHIGHWLTRVSETFFSLPDPTMQFSQHGLMGGARAMRMAQSTSVPDPILAQNITNFMRDCVNPELLINPSAIGPLMKSNDIWAAINGLSLINPGRMAVLIKNNSGIAEPCDVVRADLNSSISSAANSEFMRIARMVNPHVPCPPTGAACPQAQALLGALLPATESLIQVTSATVQDAIMQRMMINALNDTTSNLSQIMNDPAAAQAALGSAIAASNANSSYAVMARIGQETLPMIRNAIELVIIGIFPIAFLLVIVAGAKGGTVLKTYVMGMFWVQLWAPLYAIVNYVGSMSAARSMRASMEGIDGIAIQNAAALLNTTISMEAIAGMLTIIVPMIAFAVVKGGEVAMSGIASSIMGPATTAAQKSGEQVGSGNVSLGNTSWGNHTAYIASANQSDMSLRWQSPSTYKIGEKGGSFTGNEDGVTGIQKDQVILTSRASQVMGNTLNNEDSSGKSSLTSRNESAGHSRRDLSSFSEGERMEGTARFMQEYINSFGSGKTISVSDAVKEARMFANAFNLNSKDTKALQEAVAVTAATHADAKIQGQQGSPDSKVAGSQKGGSSVVSDVANRIASFVTASGFKANVESKSGSSDEVANNHSNAEENSVQDAITRIDEVSNKLGENAGSARQQALAHSIGHEAGRVVEAHTGVTVSQANTSMAGESEAIVRSAGAQVSHDKIAERFFHTTPGIARELLRASPSAIAETANTIGNSIPIESGMDGNPLRGVRTIQDQNAIGNQAVRNEAQSGHQAVAAANAQDRLPVHSTVYSAPTMQEAGASPDAVKPSEFLGKRDKSFEEFKVAGHQKIHDDLILGAAAAKLTTQGHFVSIKNMAGLDLITTYKGILSDLMRDDSTVRDVLRQSNGNLNEKQTEFLKAKVKAAKGKYFN